MPASSYRSCVSCGYQYTFKGGHKCFRCGRPFVPKKGAKGKGGGDTEPSEGGGDSPGAVPKPLELGDFVPGQKGLLQPADPDESKARLGADIEQQRWSARLRSDMDELGKRAAKLEQLLCAERDLQSEIRAEVVAIGKLKLGIKELESRVTAASADRAPVADGSAASSREAQPWGQGP